MINKLLFKLTAKMPCLFIDLDSGPYLERYYVGQLFGLTFYLHRFVSSDSERHLHNHPWRWGRSLVLSGGYVEEQVVDLCPVLPSGCVTDDVTVRWWNKVDGNHFHRVKCAKPNTWTLFFHSERVAGKGWGFIDTNATQDATVFTPYNSSAPSWWLTAPKGENAGRVVCGIR